MENENTRNDVIISAVEFISWGIKIKDEKGLVYNIPQYKKGTTEETVAYKKISQLPNSGMNLKKTLEFVNVANSQGGHSRYVRNILDISGQPNTISRGEQIARQGISNSKTKLEEDKWAEISKGKTRCLVSCDFIKLGNQDLTPVLANKINRWVDFIMTGKLFEEVKEEVEMVNVEEDLNEINVDDIPF